MFEFIGISLSKNYNMGMEVYHMRKLMKKFNRKYDLLCTA